MNVKDNMTMTILIFHYYPILFVGAEIAPLSGWPAFSIENFESPGAYVSTTNFYTELVIGGHESTAVCEFFRKKESNDN